jgi:hypothetical protein
MMPPVLIGLAWLGPALVQGVMLRLLGCNVVVVRCLGGPFASTNRIFDGGGGGGGVHYVSEHCRCFTMMGGMMV